MATRKTRKAAVKTRAAKKTTKRATRTQAAPASAAAAKMFDMSMGGLGQTLERLNLSGVAGTIAEGRRKDLAALVAANKKSYEGLQAVVARQTAMLKNAVAQVVQPQRLGHQGQHLGVGHPAA